MIVYFILGFLSFLVVGLIVFYFLQKRNWDLILKSRLDEQEIELQEEFEKAKEHALLCQRGILLGFFLEKFSLYIEGFPYNPFDVYPIPHAPIDFIAFCELEESNGTHCESIDLLELKTGSDKRLTDREKAIKECADAGRIRYRKVSHKKDGSPYIVETPCKKPQKEEPAP